MGNHLLGRGWVYVRRHLAMVLACILCMGLFPSAVSADGGSETIVSDDGSGIEFRIGEAELTFSAKKAVEAVDTDVKPNVTLRPLEPSPVVMGIASENVSGLYWCYPGWGWNGRGDGWMSHHLLPAFTETAPAGDGVTLTGYALRSSLFVEVDEAAVRSWYENSREKGTAGFDGIWKREFYDGESYGTDIVNPDVTLYHCRVYDGYSDTWHDRDLMGGVRKLEITGADGSKTFKYVIDGQASIRRLDDGDRGHVYVYCIQRDRADEAGASYEIEDVLSSEYASADARKHIQYIVERGYWGTDSGIGSLEEVRALVKDTSVDPGSITEGMAMAATQAALWYYGSGGDGMYGRLDDIFARCWSLVTAGYEYGQIGMLSDGERAAAMALFEALLAKDVPADELAVKPTTDVIMEDDLIGPDIVVTRFPDGNDDIYGFDVAVSIKPEVVEGMDLRGLEAVVYMDGTEIGRKAVTDTSVSVPVDGVPMDAELRVEVVAKQELREGVYLFLSEESQAMAGYVKGGIKSVRRSVMRKFVKEDLTGFELPDTGGTGTVPFVLMGAAMTSFAVLFMAYGRKRRRYG